MKLDWIIFGLLLVMCGSLGSLLLTPEPTVVMAAGEPPIAAGHGIPHARIGTMLAGGDGLQRYAPIRTASWIFAVCMICFFTALLALASLKAGRSSPINWFLMIGCAGQMLGMVGMILSYESFLGDATPALHGAFPAPTAWMLYVLWPAPLLFVAFYVVVFDRWTFRPEDEKAFQVLLQRRAGMSVESKESV